MCANGWDLKDSRLVFYQIIWSFLWKTCIFCFGSPSYWLNFGRVYFTIGFSTTYTWVLCLERVVLKTFSHISQFNLSCSNLLWSFMLQYLPSYCLWGDTVILKLNAKLLVKKLQQLILVAITYLLLHLLSCVQNIYYHIALWGFHSSKLLRFVCFSCDSLSLKIV